MESEKLKSEKWVIEISKIKEDDHGKEFIDKKYRLVQIFNTNFIKITDEHLSLMLQKFFNELLLSNFIGD